MFGLLEDLGRVGGVSARKSLENETPHQNKFGAGHAFLAVFVLKQNFLASPVIHRGFLLGITGEIWFFEEGFLRCGI